MGRLYQIIVTNAQTGELVRQADGFPFDILSSQQPIGGRDNPGALQIEFDLPVTAFHQPISQGMLRVWGVGIPAVYQSTNFNPTLGNIGDPNSTTNWCNISIYGGMSQGLPLANPKQSGLLMAGSIQQAFGRWEGTDQYVEFVIGPSASDFYGTGTALYPVNGTLQWQPQQQLGDAVAATLASAFPKADVVLSVRQDIVAPEPQAAQFESIDALALWANETSRAAINAPTYLGFSIFPTQKGFLVWDGTVKPPTNDVSFIDLIGQPTWIGPALMTFKTVLRGDINPGDLISMPTVPTASTPSSFAQYHARPTFAGTFFVRSARHCGRFRERDASGWVSIFEVVPFVSGAAA